MMCEVDILFLLINIEFKGFFSKVFNLDKIIISTTIKELNFRKCFL